MGTKKKLLTASEMLEILNKQWATASDMALLSGKCIAYARADFNALANEITADGTKLPSRLVPMQEVVNFYKINISYLKKISKQEVMMFNSKRNKFNVKISEKAKYVTPKEYCLKARKSIKKQKKQTKKPILLKKKL